MTVSSSSFQYQSHTHRQVATGPLALEIVSMSGQPSLAEDPGAGDPEEPKSG